jgi:hypothetical protein
MRKTLLSGALVCLAILQLPAQRHQQFDTAINRTTAIIPTDKAELLKNVDLIANTQTSFNNYIQDGKYIASKFTVGQFRLEIKGDVFRDKVYFRFRDRYTKGTEPQSVDDISRSTDLAYIGYRISPKTSIAMGKMCAAWGGYEFDLNPIDIYEYNDIVASADNFLTGVQFNWQPSASHGFTLQVLNSRTKSFEEIYDTIPGMKKSRFPAAYTVNWQGIMAGGTFRTLWSFSILQEATTNKPVNTYYWALGNQYTTGNLLMQYDFKWSREDLDRTFIISDAVPDSYSRYAARNTDYIEHWLRLVYTFNSRWSISAIGMVSSAYWRDRPDRKNTSGRYRTSWGIIPSIELYPIKNYNLKFFAAYVGRFYRYSGYAKTDFGAENTNTGRLMLGLIAPILVL